MEDMVERTWYCPIISSVDKEQCVTKGPGKHAKKKKINQMKPPRLRSSWVMMRGPVWFEGQRKLPEQCSEWATTQETVPLSNRFRVHIILLTHCSCDMSFLPSTLASQGLQWWKLGLCSWGEGGRGWGGWVISRVLLNDSWLCPMRAYHLAQSWQQHRAGV